MWLLGFVETQRRGMINRVNKREQNLFLACCDIVASFLPIISGRHRAGTIRRRSIQMPSD